MRESLEKILSVVLEPSAASRRQRRALATIVLIIAVTMVLVGSLFLQAGISPGTSIVFWGICFLLMFWAVYLAYLDVKCIKREFRTQRKELFLSTFSDRPEKKDAPPKRDNLPPDHDSRERGTLQPDKRERQ